MFTLHVVDPTNNDTVLEVYSLPRDIWIKELEDIKGKLAAAAEAKQQPQSTVITEATVSLHKYINICQSFLEKWLLYVIFTCDATLHTNLRECFCAL